MKSFRVFVVLLVLLLLGGTVNANDDWSEWYRCFDDCTDWYRISNEYSTTNIVHLAEGAQWCTDYCDTEVCEIPVLAKRGAVPFIAVEYVETPMGYNTNFTVCDPATALSSCADAPVVVYLNGIGPETEADCGGIDQGCTDYDCCYASCSSWIDDNFWPILKVVMGGIIDDMVAGSCRGRWGISAPISCVSDCNAYDCAVCCDDWENQCVGESCGSNCDVNDCALCCDNYATGCL